jgi:hypothetical protein
MADRQWFAEGVQVFETGTEEWFAEGVRSTTIYSVSRSRHQQRNTRHRTNSEVTQWVVW